MWSGRGESRVGGSGRGRGRGRGRRFGYYTSSPYFSDGIRTVEKRGAHNVNYAPVPPGQYVPGMKAQRVLPMKRNYEIDEQGVPRKKVKGGRIKKNVKPRDHDLKENDLYCEPCGRYFPCITSKNAHDSGKKHRRKIEENREEEGESSEDDDAVQITPPPRKLNPQMAKELANEIVSNLNIPRSFKSWAEKSMKSRGKEKHSVWREILYTFVTCKNNGTMLAISWDTQPPATGQGFQTETPTVNKEITFTDEQAKKMESKPPTRAPPRPNVQEIASNADEPMGINQDKDKDSNAVLLAPASAPPLRKTKITWNVSRRARFLAGHHKANEEYPKEVEVLFYARHANLEVERYDASKPTRLGAEFRENAARMYARFETSVNESTYDTKELVPQLLELIKDLQESGRKLRLIQDSLYLIVKVALEHPNIDEFLSTVRSSLEMYMDSQDYLSGSSLVRSECTAHWLISQLFKEKYDVDGEAGHYLDVKLSTMPRSSIQSEGGRYGLRILSAVLRGDHVAFCRMYNNDPFHAQCESRSRYLLEHVMELVRIRALLMFGRSSPSTGSSVYISGVVGFHSIMRQLNYFDEGEDGAERWLRHDAQSDLEKASLVVTEKGPDGAEDGTTEVVVPSNEPGKLQLSALVNAKLAFGFVRKENLSILNHVTLL